MANTKIEWAEKVWNPVVGCTKISPGCQNCYAERMAARLENIAYKTGNQKLHDKYYPTINCNGTWTGKVSLCPDALDEPLRWKKPSRIFVCSMGDLFHEDVPYEFIYDIWDVMVKNRQHTFLILSKRPDRMKSFIERVMANRMDYAYMLGNTPEGKEARKWAQRPIQNIWLGVTAENQEQADKRITILLQIPAAVRFVSVEPMLGPVHLNQINTDSKAITLNALTGTPYDWDYGEWMPEDNIGAKIDWVICGGETGPGARPMHRDWARELRDQCKAAGVPFLFKQWGEWSCQPWNSDNKTKRELCLGVDGNSVCAQVGHMMGFRKPDDVLMVRVGKKVAGRLLDGRIWDEYPEVTP